MTQKLAINKIYFDKKRKSIKYLIIKSSTFKMKKLSINIKKIIFKSKDLTLKEKANYTSTNPVTKTLPLAIYIYTENP